MDDLSLVNAALEWFSRREASRSDFGDQQAYDKETLSHYDLFFKQDVLEILKKMEVNHIPWPEKAYKVPHDDCASDRAVVGPVTCLQVLKSVIEGYLQHK